MANAHQTPVEVQEEKTKQKKNGSVIYQVLILALTILCIYWYLQDCKSVERIMAEGHTINIDSSNIVDLNARYHAEMDSLYSYKGQNAILDSLLNIKIGQLANMEKNLAEVRKTKQMDETVYQKSMADLNSITSDMKNQIAELQKENGILISRNDSLGKNLAVIVGTNQQLNQQKATLAAKLTRASLLVPVNVMSDAIKVGSSGKESTTSNNKKAKRIRVTFDIPATNTVDTGTKTFYLVVTDTTKGAVLTDPTQGSGVFQTAECGTQQQYTASKTISFNQQKQHVEIEWNSMACLDKGNYTAEIFQDGYLTNKSLIKLK